MKKKIDFAFIWEEEYNILRNLAATVPEDGTIVEIGTAKGGTACIFHDETRTKNVSITTIDINTDPRAIENLRDTDVSIITAPSKDYAKEWKKSGRTVDLLYIDGDHTFEGIYNDFVNWSGYLSAGGTIVFHDYDPQKRGGVAHFPIRVFLDTLLRLNFFNNWHHDHKLLHGHLKEGSRDSLTVDAFIETLGIIGKDICEFRRRVTEKSVQDGVRQLVERSGYFDSVQACYVLEYILRHEFLCCDLLTDAWFDFRKYAEVLSMFQHSAGGFEFPDVVPELKSIQCLSELLAREQVRLFLLANILQTLVKWKP